MFINVFRDGTLAKHGILQKCIYTFLNKLRNKQTKKTSLNANLRGHIQRFWVQAAHRISAAHPLLPAATCGSGDAAPWCVEEERERVRCPMTAQDAERGCWVEWRRQDAVYSGEGEELSSIKVCKFHTQHITMLAQMDGYSKSARRPPVLSLWWVSYRKKHRLCALKNSFPFRGRWLRWHSQSVLTTYLRICI